jgi:hypothetical protein
MKYDFIEIGTCDFETLCQTCEDWQIGISIDVVKIFLDNLPDRPNVQKINAAISDEPGESILYTISEETVKKYELPPWVRGCSKLDGPNEPVVKELRNRNIEHLYEKVPVKKITISEILEKNLVNEIGVFKTDLEGHDIKVINSLLDYGKVLPNRIIFEYNSGESEKENLELLIGRLKSFGYEQIELRGDNYTFDLKKRIMVVSMYDQNYRDIADVTIFKNFKKYCSFHGYELKSHFIERSERAVQWEKISLLRDLMINNEADWFFFIDADCLFMNTPRRIEDYIDNNYFLIIPSGGGSVDNDLDGDFRNNNMMSSQMLIKNCQESIDFLNEVWDAPDWPEGMHLDEFDHEMRQMRISYLKPRWKPRIKIIEEKLLNRFWPVPYVNMAIAHKHINLNTWQPGDFIVHVTGYPREERALMLKDIDIFSGGLVAQWSYEPGKILMRPLDDIENMKVVLYNKNGDHVMYWNFEKTDHRSFYWMAIDDFKPDEQYFKVFNRVGKEIALHKF